ncbi:MAG TPA: protein kinase [Polyangiaceae bacterium]|nr:protein kinase [Polyangiaceae bacterium]
MAAEALRAGAQGLPKRIGKYDAFLQIGAGGMARVYLAVQRGAVGQKPELVAVKLLRPDVVEDEHVLSLFTDEARIAMRLQHPNVIRTREVIASPPDFLLAMDFLNGRSLLDVLTRLGRESVPLAEHVHVLAQVLAGLSYAHELRDEHGQPFGLVHRDVSPANVLIAYTGEVKLIDFGIAKATGALAATQDGVVRGKLGYAAPEQALGKPADPRSDVYAVGVMLWEAVARRRRVTGETWQSVLQARMDDKEPALEDVCPDAPPALVAIVRKAVAWDPSDRYQTAKEFQTDLTKYLRQQGGAPIGPSRIAAMLKPHFEKDRAALQQAIENHLNSQRAPGRLPLPGARPAAPVTSLGDTLPPATVPTKEETTAPIPVDSALLMLTRGEEPAVSAAPTVPPPAPTSEASTAKRRAPDVASPAPSAVATAKPPPPDESMFSDTTVVMAPPSEELAASERAAITAKPPPPVDTPKAAPVETAVNAPPIVGAAAAAAPRVSPVSLDPFGLVAVAKPTATPGWASVAASPPPKKKMPLWPLALLAVGAIGLAAAVLGPRFATKAPVAVAAPVETTEPKAAESAASGPKVEKVDVRISVDPPDAVVELDGKELTEHPYVAKLPRDNVPHHLIATAEGCKDVAQDIHLNANVALLVAMKCQRQGLRLTGKPLLHKPTAGAAPAAASAAPTPPPEQSPDNPYQ